MNGKFNWKKLRISTVDNYYAHEYGAVVFDIPFKLEISCSMEYTEHFLKALMVDAIVNYILKINWPILNPTGECNITVQQTDNYQNHFHCVFLPTDEHSYKFYKCKSSTQL